ncbi:hypothetical protein JVU11DRAFT_2426 [Chiua virens]|nr:hypothetical protein JVU11DRAFT_2426 [Chiua virens]
MVRPAAHSFPHRGSPSTSHTRVRWQPYHASLQSIPPRTSSPLAYLVTPASSVSSSPRALSEPDRPRHAHHPPRESKLRDNQKSKFAFSLVDRAVKSLCDIWPQQDIPTVFLTSGRPTVSSDHHYPTTTINPVTRDTYYPLRSLQQHIPRLPFSPVAVYSAQLVADPQLQRPDVAPMTGFVHEVLRRSRTSGNVLQTALCYLEAIRSKIPDLVRKEKQAFSSSSSLGSDEERISQGEVGIDFDTDLCDSIHSADIPPTDNLLATVRINPVLHEPNLLLSTKSNLDADRVSAHSPKTDDALPPLPPLPSPLLCPRRAFLASLILASKFMQDRCYSNRAWAKLSGLPPREIGRCERALGEALEWRLWVGKLPAVQSTSKRVLTKSKSETDILLSGNSPMVGDTDLVRTSFSVISPKEPRTGSLKRCATLPAGNLYTEGLQVTRMDNTSPSSYSSSPSTPGLSYSPTPTESSLGDRTVQMTTFMDVSTPPPGQFATFTGAQNDKVPATFFVPSTGLFVPTSLQDMALAPLSQRIDTQYLMSHGAVPPNSVWMFNDDA